MAFKKGRKGPKSRFNRFNHNHDSGFSRLNANPALEGMHDSRLFKIPLLNPKEIYL